jgi:pimeloyl-ACP methyl ester carboxylesterase
MLADRAQLNLDAPVAFYWPEFAQADKNDILVRWLLPPQSGVLRLDQRICLKQLLPNAQLAVIPDAGHFVLYEDPEKLLPIIANFLDQPASTVPFATTIAGYHPSETR